MQIFLFSSSFMKTQFLLVFDVQMHITVYRSSIISWIDKLAATAKPWFVESWCGRHYKGLAVDSIQVVLSETNESE